MESRRSSLRVLIYLLVFLPSCLLSARALAVTLLSPQDVAVLPAADAQHVLTDTEIIAEFSSLAIAKKNKIALTHNGLPLAGLITRDGKQLRFVPSSPLAKGTQYQVSLYENNHKQPRFVSAFTTISPKLADIVFYENFDQLPRSTYSENMLASIWGGYSFAGIAQGRVAVINAAQALKGQLLQITFASDQFGVDPGGAQWKLRLGQHDELYASYSIKFDPDFEFVKGGKIPGLRGGNAKGKIKPTGMDRFSARIMWRKQGKIVQYVYHADQPHQHGDELPWKIGGQRFFSPGKWHRIETRVKLNTPGVKNGIIQSWLDGELAFDKRDFRFRDTNALHIDIFDFSTFFGGSDRSWATKKQEQIYFDNLIISKVPITLVSQRSLASQTANITSAVNVSK